MNPTAQVKSASKTYKTGDTLITALHESTVEFHQGELTLILGPSGSGKTTLLSLLGCVIYPTAGEVWIGDTKVNDLSEKELAWLRLNKIGFVFQSFNLIAPLNALENVMLPLELMNVPRNQARERALEALSKVNMLDRVKNLPKMLSGGQQQRVAIARALVTNPPLMLCDEPTAALDTKSVGVVMDELKMLAREGKALAVVTHDLRLKQFADRIIYVNNGRVSERPQEETIELH
jgi:putative ABC transport system ATP-binding protein